MTFVKLTNHAGEAVYIHTSNITSFYAYGSRHDGSKSSKIHTNDGSTWEIAESPEQIIESTQQAELVDLLAKYTVEQSGAEILERITGDDYSEFIKRLLDI